MRKKEKKINKNFGKLAVVLLFILLVTMTASQALIKAENTQIEKILDQKDNRDNKSTTLDDPYYVWTDEFDNEQYIDSTKSYDYSLLGGQVKMKGTYEIWTDTSWEKMKPISSKTCFFITFHLF